VVGFIVGGVCYGGAVDVLTLLLVVKIGSSRSRSCGRCRQKCCCFCVEEMRAPCSGEDVELAVARLGLLLVALPFRLEF